VILLGAGGVCGVAAGQGPVDPMSLLKVRALWMVALRLVLLMGCNTNLEPKTQSCCGCGAAGAYWWCEMVAGWQTCQWRGEWPAVGVM